MSECHGWTSTIVKPNERLEATALGLARSIAHRSRIIKRPGQRFLAGHVLACLECGNRLICMNVIGRTNIDKLDGLIIENVIVRRRRAIPSPFASKGSCLFGIPCANRLHQGLTRQIEELVDAQPGVGMGTPHELRPDERDVQRFAHACCSLEPRRLPTDCYPWASVGLYSSQTTIGLRAAPTSSARLITASVGAAAIDCGSFSICWAI